MKVVAYLSGFLMLLLIWVVYRLMTGTWNIWKLVGGADGRVSTSKLQWFLWTVVVIYCYTAVYIAKAWKGDYGVITDIPQNLLIVMGLSITTMAAAKGITVSYVSRGQVIKPQAAPGTAGLGASIQDDGGAPDLSKLQMMAWTLIAILAYLLRVTQQLGKVPTLPDIDTTLMVLMGLGEGAYLGKKLVTTSVPRLTGLSPGNGEPGIEVTIMGLSFGAKQNGSLITTDGKPFQPEGVNWADNEITFTLPDKQPDGSAWVQGRQIMFGLVVGGQESTNKLPFTVVPP